MEISPSGDVVRVSGPVTGHNAGELIRAIVERNPPVDAGSIDTDRLLLGVTEVRRCARDEFAREARRRGSATTSKTPDRSRPSLDMVRR
jgi:hypothetical protein